MTARVVRSYAIALTVTTIVSCARNTSSVAGKHVHADDASAANVAGSLQASPSQTSPQGTALPAGADGAVRRLAVSPRHAEWVMIRTGNDSVRAWVVYPERRVP